jgi:CubicO group peptidase (beta-lactamase class C family)
MCRLVPLFVLLLAAAPARAADFDPKPIDDLVEKAMAEFRVPGAAVVVVQDDRVVYLKGFGVREQGGEPRVTPDTVFAIASCSKAFTSTLAAMTVADGKLGWDDKVRDHLPAFRLSDELADREVTVRDLLCHRTGMPRHDWLWSNGSGEDNVEELIRRWGRGRHSTSFRSTWEYSNVPFTTAGLLAGKLVGADWAAATRKRVFTPLKMNNSSCTWKEAEAAADHATPHYLGADKAIKPIKWDRIDHAGGAGCVNSTARDMGNWLRFHLAGGEFDGKRLLAERHLRETHSPQMLVKLEGAWLSFFPPRVTRFASYGLGWFVHDYRGHTVVSHGGTLTGFRAQLMMVPEKKVGVFAVCNLRPSGFTEAVTRSVLDHVLGLPAEDWVKHQKGQQQIVDFQLALNKGVRAMNRAKDTEPSLEPEKYAATYEEPAYGKLEVTKSDDGLRLKSGKYVFRLEHHHYDTFTAIPVEPVDEVFQFDRQTLDAHFRLGPDGKVEGVKFLEQEFKRKK